MSIVVQKWNQDASGELKNIVFKTVCPGSCDTVCSETKWTATRHKSGAHHLQPSGTHCFPPDSSSFLMVYVVFQSFRFISCLYNPFLVPSVSVSPWVTASFCLSFDVSEMEFPQSSVLSGSIIVILKNTLNNVFYCCCFSLCPDVGIARLWCTAMIMSHHIPWAERSWLTASIWKRLQPASPVPLRSRRPRTSYRNKLWGIYIILYLCVYVCVCVYMYVCLYDDTSFMFK